MSSKKRVNFNIDEGIHREFNSVCALIGLSMSEVVESRMEEFINAYNKIKGIEVESEEIKGDE